MTEGIIIAIIGAAGMVLAAIIGLFSKNNNGKTIEIRQKQKGENNTQFGGQAQNGNENIINNYYNCNVQNESEHDNDIKAITNEEIDKIINNETI